MTDVLTPEQRQLNMSRIRGKDTSLELKVRLTLHSLGLRYRLHVRGLPGTPDLVFPRYSSVIFVHGCFWHCHAGCSLAKLPATREEFWREKLSGNARRDSEAAIALKTMGWRVLTIWECALRGPRKLALEDPARQAQQFIVAPSPRPIEMTIPVDAGPLDKSQRNQR